MLTYHGIIATERNDVKYRRGVTKYKLHHCMYRVIMNTLCTWG